MVVRGPEVPARAPRHLTNRSDRGTVGGLEAETSGLPEKGIIVADVLVVGGGVVGLGTAMLLAKDGHQVTLLERDPAPPPDGGDAAWDSWERRGVNQFRLPHAFLGRYRALVDAELPQVARALEAAGALRQNPFLDIPEDLRGPERPGDGDFEILTGRRPVVEMAMASVAEVTPGLTVRRGEAVEGLITGPEARNGTPHVVGVRTATGDEVRSDLVVDMSGRRSPLPRWLADAGLPPLQEEVEDSGFMYYARHYRSADGSLPFAFGPALQPLGTISSLTLPADNGTWSAVVTTSAKDKALYGLRDVDRFEAVFRSLPLVAHWLDGEPLEDRIVTMTKIEDRWRSMQVDGEPIVTGLVAVGDAWACSNPSFGRGASIGTLHGVVLRDTLREHDGRDPYALARGFHAATSSDVEPWFMWTRFQDRHRLAQIDSLIAGEPYEPGDARWELEQALSAAINKDPDLLRLALRAAFVLEPLEGALAANGVSEQIMELGADWRDEPVPAPARDELVALANG
jgi:2-polyprenyl-6-methoxyphenol hydroxylase-like FAD-dependent oxidoreductase